MKHVYNDPLLKERRRNLRNNSSNEEKILWKWLRGKKMNAKFRRQTSIGPYVVDFYCPALKLVVELDGVQHEDSHQYDNVRDFFLHEQGCQILRFPNWLVHNDLNKVLDSIQEAIYLVSERRSV